MSLIDSEFDQEASIASLRAFELELTDGTDQALEALVPFRDAIRTDAALRILIRAGRIDDAADLIRDRKPEAKWACRAAYIFAFRHELDKAMGYVSYSDRQQDLQIMQLTRLGFTEGLINSWTEENRGDSLFNVRWKPDEREMAGKALRLLDPVLATVEANRKIADDTERYGIQYAIQLSEICQRRERIPQFVEWLLQFSPAPLFLGELALCRKIDVPNGLVTRFLIEHSSSFQAGYLSALIERDLLKNPERAFSILTEVAAEAVTDAEKESVCVRLFETVGACTAEKVQVAIDAVDKLLPNDQRLSGLLKIFQLVQEGATDRARSELDRIRDEKDGVWWQAQAQLCEREGNEDEAQAAWVKASELLPHKDVISRGIQASIDQRRFSSVIRGAKLLLEQEPDNEKALSTIAWAHSQLGDHAYAIPHLERLVEIVPNDPEYRIRLAQCLTCTSRPSDAVTQLREVCKSDEAPVEATFMLSEVLGNENAGEAFELLESISADHWDDPSFVMLFMKRAHAASEESRANEAMARLIELRNQGKVPDAMMRPVSLEEVLEFGKQREENRKSLQEAVINGRMAWLFVEELANNPVSWAWRLHTQQLGWNSEERLSRAAFSIYATNGFTAAKGDDGKVRLEQLSLLDSQCEVVVDITALVTLHELGCLKDAAASLGKFVLPSTYGDLRYRDSDRLSDHQPIIRSALLRIEKAIVDGRIKVEQNTNDFLHLDHYSEESNGNRIRISDIVNILETLQKCSSTTLADLRRRADTNHVSDERDVDLRVGCDISAELFTLKTIAETDAFESLIDTFSIHVSAADHNRIQREVGAYNASDRANESQRKLWTLVAELVEEGSIEWRSIGDELEQKEVESADDVEVIYLDSVRLSAATGIPLLADDRVLQLAAFQGQPLDPHSAFDTQQFLLSLHRRGEIESSAIAEQLMRLMKWRYRFLIPPSPILFTWAKDGLQSLPGPHLLEAACYLHDCLRDPGLHCGLESTDPPMPIALRFVTKWTESLAQLLAKVWNDTEIDEDKATELTAWVCTEFVPSCPRGLLGHAIGFSLAQNQARSMLKLAQVLFTSVRDQERANLGLRTIASSLGFTDDEFLTVSIEGLDVAKL